MLNHPKISVIIPNYNGAKTLPLCLKAIFSSNYPNFEVIVVDDKSTDNSCEIINSFNVKLFCHKKNKRQGAARNTGANQAKGEILVFIDSDVCVKKDTLSKIAAIFSEKKELTAIVGLPDKTCVYKNLASVHFNRRVHYNYSILPDYINVLYGTISAVKKDAFKKIGGFDESIRGVEDSEIGYRLRAAGYKIYHSKNISVMHHKKIGLRRLFKNDFGRAVDRVKLLLGKKRIKKMVLEKRFITSPFSQILSPIVALLSLIFFWGWIFYKPLIILSGIFILIFIFLNMKYLIFNGRENGLLLSLKLLILIFFDMLVVSAALFWGAILFLRGKKY